MPTAGVSESTAFSAPEDGTCLDAHNMVPFDPRTDRQRISKRSGLVNLFNTQVNGSAAVQDINEVVVAVTETLFKELEAPTVDWQADPGAGLETAVVDPDGFVYVVGARDGGNSVWKLNGTTGATVASFDTGGNTRGIAITPNADTPYIHVVGASGAGGVHLWKLSTDLVSQWSADLGGAGNIMYGIAVDDDGNVYVTGNRNLDWNGSGGTAQRNAWKLTAAGAISTTNIDFGASINPISLALFEDRTIAVCGDRVGSKSVWWGEYTTSDGTILGSADAGTNAKGVAFDKFGRLMVVGTNTSGVNMWVFNPDRSLHSTHDIGGGNVNLTKVKTDPDDGSIFLVGDRLNGASVWKLNSDFVQKWAYDSTHNVNGVAIGLEGDIIICQDYDGSGAAEQLSTKDEQTIINVPRTKKYITIAGGQPRRFDTQSGFIDISGQTMHQSKRIFSTQAFSKVYFVDGENYCLWNPVANTFDYWIPTAGNLPDDVVGDGIADSGKGARLICTWRGRVVLSAAGDDPHNWFMSAVGDPLNYDYSPTDQSESQAVAGNNSSAGLIGDVVTALIPYSDDLLLVGADASLWRMTGDPMAGGRIDLVSDVTGVAFGKAWCKDPEGFVYFFGQMGGMYRMAPGGIPERLSNTRLERRLQNVDTGANIIRMVWDHTMQGVHLTITPFDTNQKAEHYFWDKRGGGFWPYSFHNGALDPTAVYVIDGDDPEDRLVVFGGRNGYLRYFDPAKAYDAPIDAGGTREAIDSYVWLGPMVGGGDTEVKVRGWRFVMGENTNGAEYEIYVGDTVEEAFNATAATSGTLTGGRNRRINYHARGGAVLCKVLSDTVDEFFSMEGLIVQPIPGGRLRVRS